MVSAIVVSRFCRGCGVPLPPKEPGTEESKRNKGLCDTCKKTTKPASLEINKEDIKFLQTQVFATIWQMMRAKKLVTISSAELGEIALNCFGIKSENK